jgi:flagellar hook-associated protein 2
MTTSTSSLLRITGLSSGLDVDTMVQTLMKAESAKLDKLKQSQTKLTWQQEAYRDISTSLVDFRNNKLFQYNSLNALSAKTSQVTGDSSAVAITSTNSTATGSLNITVSNTATTASAIYQTTATAITNDSTMADLLGTSGDNRTITINSISYSYNSTDKVSDVLARINSDKTLNATVMVGSDGKLSIRNNATGKSGITVGGDLNVMGAPSSSDSGSDASYTVNGITMTSSSNFVSLNGYNMQLLQASAANSSTTITSKVDTDSIVNTIKSFINDYNSILDQVNTKLNEQTYNGYPPLTDDQRAAMTDSQITLWESNAKSGLLKNDSILSSMVSSMRLAAVATVNTGSPDVKTIQSIGIVTGSWSENGKLHISDEGALRAAIEKNPDAIISLFTAKGTDIDATKPESPTSGLFTKLSATIMDSLTGLSQKAGTSAYSSDKTAAFMANSLMGDQLRDLSNRIDDMNTYLTNKENQYYQKFTAMETAMNQYSSQASAFSSYSS